MPLLRLETAVTISDETRTKLLKTLSKIVAETLGKPEQYVMVTISPTAIFMSGKAGNAAFVDLRSIGGPSGEAKFRLTEKLCQVLDKSLGVPSDRAYIMFTDVRASDWGWNGTTFG